MFILTVLTKLEKKVILKMRVMMFVDFGIVVSFFILCVFFVS